MKVLYIGYYKENSEWGKMATNFILSMHEAGIEVVPRAIELSQGREVGGLIAQLEKGDIEDCDYCIQHVFPDHVTGSGKFKKNIALLTNDFIEIAHTSAVEKLSLADEVWVTNKDSQETLSKVASVPVKVVYPGFREELYGQQYEKVQLGSNVDNTFKFYTVINSIPERDNILSAFHAEFEVAEPATLILFSTNPDKEFSNKLNAWSEDIKSRLRIKQRADMFTSDVVLHMPQSTESDLYALHQYADCYISSSQGDSWPVTAFDAACFGNTPIMAANAGAKEFSEGCYLVPSVKSVSLSSGQVSELRNGRDYIVTPCHKAIREAMRAAYEGDRKASRSAGLEVAKKFSLLESGKRIKELLNV